MGFEICRGLVGWGGRNFFTGGTSRHLFVPSKASLVPVFVITSADGLLGWIGQELELWQSCLCEHASRTVRFQRGYRGRVA